ncbi:MAG TPA: hypothetical protein VLZ28_03750 [Daejeonella sp.]|nr:hypothetical protein [Daejeonella sp.]
MIVKVIKMGDSVGVMLPRAFVEQCSIKDEVSLEVKGNTIVIKTFPTHPRHKWRERFLRAGSLNDNELLMGEFDNSFDRKEWTW